MSRDDLRTKWEAWHYTPGWGSAATVTVACIAVGINVFSQRRASKNFRQTRIDAQADKLRIELGALLTQLTSRRNRANRLRERLAELVADSRNANHDTDRLHTRTQAAYSEIFAEFYDLSTAHCLNILMLSGDKAILSSVVDIVDSLKADQEVWVKMTSDLKPEGRQELFEQAQLTADELGKKAGALASLVVPAFLKNAAELPKSP